MNWHQIPYQIPSLNLRNKHKTIQKFLVVVTALLLLLSFGFQFFQQKSQSLVRFTPQAETLSKKQIKLMKQQNLNRYYDEGLKQYYESIQSKILLIKLSPLTNAHKKLTIFVNSFDVCFKIECEKAINSVLELSSTAQIIWVTKNENYSTEGWSFRSILVQHLRFRQIAFEAKTQIVDSSYNFILKHLNNSHKRFVSITNQMIIKSIQLDTLLNEKQNIVFYSKVDKSSQLDKDCDLSKLNKDQINQAVYSFPTKLIKIITPLNFAFQDIYNFEQLVVLPLLALSQLSSSLRQLSFASIKLIEGESQLKVNATEFRLSELPQDTQYSNKHICFVGAPTVPQKNSVKQLKQYLSTFQDSKPNKYFSVFIGLVYERQSNLNQVVEKALSLDQSGIRVKLRVRQIKTTLSQQLYQVSRSYCPTNCTLFTSRYNVRPKIEQIFKSISKANLCKGTQWLMLSNYVINNKTSAITNIVIQQKYLTRTCTLPYFQTHLYHAQIFCSFLVKEQYISTFKWQEIEFYDTEASFSISLLERARKNFTIVTNTLYEILFERQISQKQKLQFQGLEQRNVHSSFKQLQFHNFSYSELNNYGYKKNAPQRISRIIHQIWLSNANQPAPIKKALLKTLQKTNPDFEYKLWTWQNVTRQNFPVTYDEILKILKQMNRTKQNFLAVAVDMMRIEVLYRHGGFYFDFKIQGKKSLSPFLKYEQFHVFLHAKSFGINMIASYKGNRHYYKLLKEYSSQNYRIFPTGNFQTTGGTKIASKYTEVQVYTQVYNFRQFAFEGVWICMYGPPVGPIEQDQEQFTGTASFEDNFQYRVRIPCKRDMQKYVGYYDILGRSYYHSNNQYS